MLIKPSWFEWLYVFSLFPPLILSPIMQENSHTNYKWQDNTSVWIHIMMIKKWTIVHIITIYDIFINFLTVSDKTLGNGRWCIISECIIFWDVEIIHYLKGYYSVKTVVKINILLILTYYPTSHTIEGYRNMVQYSKILHPVQHWCNLTNGTPNLVLILCLLLVFWGLNLQCLYNKTKVYSYSSRTRYQISNII